MSKIIAVIGATGAQGLPAIRHLLAPSKTGTPSPWKIRALTRNTQHRRAKELESLGAELIEGSYQDSNAIHKLFEGGVHGAFVNTDGFTVGAAAELSAAFEIWEIAQYHQVRHFVWSNLDYALRLGKYDPRYTVDHYNAKGRFAHYLEAQPNPINEADGTTWSILTTGPYMDMLVAVLAPTVLPDGTRVFPAPFGPEGRVPLIALEDLGWWTRYIFDNPSLTTGKELKVTSQIVSYPEIVETFKKVTGLPAVFKSLTEDEFFGAWRSRNVPVAVQVPDGKTMEGNFKPFFRLWKDGVITRDMDWIRSIHEPTSLERWMRESKYEGKARLDLLKTVEDRMGKSSS